MMKTLKTMLVLFIISGFTIVKSFATNGDSLENRKMATFNQSESIDKFELVYVGNNPEDVVVKIYNSLGQRIFTDRISSQKKFKKPYDLSRLPKDEYIVEISDKDGAYQDTVYNYEKLVPMNVFVDVRKQDDKYHLIVKGAEGKDVYVNIMTPHNKLIHSDVINRSGAFAVTYDFSRLHYRDVDFQIYCEGRKIK